MSLRNEIESSARLDRDLDFCLSCLPCELSNDLVLPTDGVYTPIDAFLKSNASRLFKNSKKDDLGENSMLYKPGLSGIYCGFRSVCPDLKAS